MIVKAKTANGKIVEGVLKGKLAGIWFLVQEDKDSPMLTICTEIVEEPTTVH